MQHPNGRRHPAWGAGIPMDRGTGMYGARGVGRDSPEFLNLHNRGATPPGGELAASLSPVDMITQQADREESARTALQEVEFDFQLGNLDEDDYRSLREHYMRRALSALKSRHDRQQALDDAIEEQ